MSIIPCQSVVPVASTAHSHPEIYAHFGRDCWSVIRSHAVLNTLISAPSIRYETRIHLIVSSTDEVVISTFFGWQCVSRELRLSNNLIQSINTSTVIRICSCCYSSARPSLSSQSTEWGTTSRISHQRGWNYFLYLPTFFSTSPLARKVTRFDEKSTVCPVRPIGTATSYRKSPSPEPSWLRSHRPSIPRIILYTGHCPQEGRKSSFTPCMPLPPRNGNQPSSVEHFQNTSNLNVTAAVESSYTASSHEHASINPSVTVRPLISLGTG